MIWGKVCIQARLGLLTENSKTSGHEQTTKTFLIQNKTAIQLYCPVKLLLSKYQSFFKNSEYISDSAKCRNFLDEYCI